MQIINFYQKNRRASENAFARVLRGNNIIIVSISTNKILYKTERGKFTSNYVTKGTWCKIKILLTYFLKEKFY